MSQNNSRRSFLKRLGGLAAAAAAMVIGGRTMPAWARNFKPLSNGDPFDGQRLLASNYTTCKGHEGPCAPDAKGLICSDYYGPCGTEVACRDHTPQDSCHGNWYSPSCGDHVQCPQFQNT